jgi:hypothetical protein
MSPARTRGVGLGLAVIALVVGLLAGAHGEETAAAAAVIGLGVPALALLAAAIRGGLPLAGRSPLELDPPPPPSRPESLVRMERALSGRADAPAGPSILPLLREVGRERLLSRRGILARRDPEAGRAALGPETWDLLDPVHGRAGRRLSVGDVRRAVDALERL